MPPSAQGGALNRKQYGGTGHWLSISKGIVTLLGGDITVESTVCKGTTFSFSLWHKEDEALEQKSGPQGECRLASGKRVLLVDDVAVNRFIVKEQLSDCGLAIDEAENGEEAVELFSQSSEGHYDVILMDVQMPRMNGYEATAVIRGMARADAAGIPIVAMTASAFREDIERALSSGMNAHLAKPLEKQKLMQVLSNYLTEG